MSADHADGKVRIPVSQSGAGGRKCGWRRAAVSVVAAMGVSVGAVVASADDQESTLFSYHVGEQGSIQGSWGGGVQPSGGEAPDLVKVSIYVPQDMAKDIEEAVEDPASNVGRVEYVLVVRGSVRAARCHPHSDGSFHCPGN